MDSEVDAAFQFLANQGASKRLVQHAMLVRDTANQLVCMLQAVGVPVVAETILIGAVLHDAGKIVEPGELDGPGDRHEAAGREFLLSAGYPPEIARMCVSHSQWQTVDCSLEELIVALADKLWKGKREDALEAMVIERVARMLGRERWQVFQELDSHFEAIAARGHERLVSTLERR